MRGEFRLAATMHKYEAPMSKVVKEEVEHVENIYKQFPRTIVKSISFDKILKKKEDK